MHCCKPSVLGWPVCGWHLWIVARMADKLQPIGYQLVLECHYDRPVWGSTKFKSGLCCNILAAGNIQLLKRC